MSFSTTTKSWSAGPGSRVRVLVAALSGLLLLALLGTALAFAEDQFPAQRRSRAWTATDSSI